MGFEYLSLSGFIDEMKEVSFGPHPRSFCFMIGAGASRSSGIKSGKELVEIWEKELTIRNPEAHGKWKASKGITDENKYNFYSQYYSRRFGREHGDGYNYMEKLTEHAKPSVGYVMLAYLLTKTPNNVVITTNFDHLIEDAVTYYSQEIPLVIGHESLAHYIRFPLKRPTVIKIHRDLLLEPISESEKVEKLHDNWRKPLGVIFSEYSPVFIGYAGNDNSLMDFLLDNVDKFVNKEWKPPYWMLYGNGSLEGKVKKFVDSTNGYAIKHDGFDKTLYLIGDKFGYIAPKEDEFLADAKKRFQLLSDSINQFTSDSINNSASERSSKEASSAEGDPDSHDDGNTGIAKAIQQVTDQSEQLRRYRRAVVFHNAGEYMQSLKITEGLIKEFPDDPLYQYTLGVTLHEMGRFEEALTAKQKAVDLEPDNARYQNSLGITLHEMGKFEDALTAKQKAVDLEPNNARYQDSLSVTLHEMGRFEQALTAVQKAVDLEPNNARYQDSLSVTLHEMGRFEQALTAVQKAVDLEPDNARYQNSLGVTLHEMGRFEEALTAKQKAVDLEPNNARYLSSLGITLHRMGRFEAALTAKQKAVDLEPDNVEYQDSLKKTLEAMGRK